MHISMPTANRTMIIKRCKRSKDSAENSSIPLQLLMESLVKPKKRRSLKTGLNTRASGTRRPKSVMERVSRYGPMDLYMKDSGRMTRLMVMED